MTLNIKNITKTYGKDKIALKDFSLTVKPGVLGLLGPNGAGKSTLLKMIATATNPTAGSILLDGENLSKNPNYMRKQLGYLPQDFGVYDNLNAFEFLRYLAALKGVNGNDINARIEHILSGLNLLDVANTPLGKYSGGMKQRIGIAQTILNNPKVILLDEPTVGLDPEERVRFRNMISELGKKAIVILSTHIVSDIDTVADEVAIMSKGKLILSNTIKNITDKAENKVFETLVAGDEFDFFQKNNTVLSYRKSDHRIHVRYISNAITSIGTPIQASLEDAFLMLTKTAANA